MSTAFDLVLAHRHFSAHCFNSVWDLIDKTDRSPGEGREMLARAMASLWHWRQRPDVGPRQLSVGCWLVSRVLCLIGQPGLALEFAKESVMHAANDEPFYRAYALEAVARAEQLAGHAEAAMEAKREALRLTAEVADADSRGMVEADLATIVV
jgi:hypothetical protein